MSDYKALFKAAKAQRTATPAKFVRTPCTRMALLLFNSLLGMAMERLTLSHCTQSKDQLRALKAQKAVAAAAEAEQAARRKAQEVGMQLAMLLFVLRVLHALWPHHITRPRSASMLQAASCQKSRRCMHAWQVTPEAML